MSTKDFVFSSKEITTIFDALQSCSAEQLACAILGNLALPAAGKRHIAALGITTRRVASMLHALSLLGPNCEASSHIILPWRSSHLSELSNMSWQDALGVRIALPMSASCDERTRFLAHVLLNMSYM